MRPERVFGGRDRGNLFEVSTRCLQECKEGGMKRGCKDGGESRRDCPKETYQGCLKGGLKYYEESRRVGKLKVLYDSKGGEQGEQNRSK